MSKIQVSMRFSPKTHAKLKALAEREHRSMARQVEHLIQRAAAELPAAQQLDIEDARPPLPTKPPLRVKGRRGPAGRA